MNKIIRKITKNKRYAIVLLVLVVASAAALYGVSRDASSPDTGLPLNTGPTATVQITADGFEPATLSVAPGTTVTWVNADDAPHQVASNPHPEHTDLSGLDSSQPIAAEQSYSFTFNETGTFGYHDHLQPTTNGMITVK